MNSDMNVQQIVELVGGADNIKTVTHCATRLRFVCKKDEVVDVKGLEGTKGVIKVILAGGQVQVVIGPQVEFVYKDVIDLIGESFASAGMEDADTSKPLGKRIVDAVFDLLSGSFTPLLPAMAGVGMVRALMVLLTSFGIVAEDSTTYSILLGIYDGFFYFLPIILSVSMANKLGSNMFIAATIAAAVLDPNIAGLVDQKDVTFFGLPLITMSYASTVLPVLITIPCYSAVYNWLKAHVSRNYQNLVVPFVCIILFVPFILFIFGPFGKYVGDLADRRYLCHHERCSLACRCLSGRLLVHARSVWFALAFRCLGYHQHRRDGLGRHHCMRWHGRHFRFHRHLPWPDSQGKGPGAARAYGDRYRPRPFCRHYRAHLVRCGAAL